MHACLFFIKKIKMSISFINRKFEVLAKKEKAVNDYYDPLTKHGKYTHIYKIFEMTLRKI